MIFELNDKFNDCVFEGGECEMPLEEETKEILCGYNVIPKLDRSLV